MKQELFSNTEIAAYFLWEYTRHNNALSLWYCAEDIAFFLEQKNILVPYEFERYVKRSKYDNVYISFLRNLAYRLHIFTNEDDHIKNWFITEKLVSNAEWIMSVCNISRIYRAVREGELGIVDSIRNDYIRKNIN